LWAALWALRKKGAVQFRGPKSTAARDLLQLRGRLMLTAQHSVHCVRIGQRDFVLGVHPSGITLLFSGAAGETSEK
jgi:flagellar biogenesis protein FliO